jgi:hypothetical protein
MGSDSIHLKLNALLDANRRFDLAAKGTTNHCPMALVALAAMGAPPARLQAFFDRWEREYALLAPPVDTTVSRSEWKAHLGERAAFGALRLCFCDWIRDVGAVRKRDFTLLHTVTATHAARIVFALLDDSLIKELLPSFWVALCAAYATVGVIHETQADVPALDLDWSDVCRMAVACDDDHVIKMTYTCLCENRRAPSPLYLASAARLVSGARAADN